MVSGKKTFKAESNMNDLVSEYQQYQDATAEEEGASVVFLWCKRQLMYLPNYRDFTMTSVRPTFRRV